MNPQDHNPLTSGPDVTMAGGKPAPGDDAAPGTTGTGENVCPDCRGSGKVSGEACANCGGSGKIVEGIGGG